MLEVKLVQVLLHHADQLDTADLPHVIAATVDDEDIWCCSSSQGVGKEGEKASPLQSTPAKPADTDARHAEGASQGLCSSLDTTPDIAVTNDPRSSFVRELAPREQPTPQG